MPSDGKSSHCLWQGELKNGYSSKTCTSLHIVHVYFHQVAMKPACFIEKYPSTQGMSLQEKVTLCLLIYLINVHVR